ncbi:phosphate acetyltransferase [Aureimonas altamirensis]|uniref:Phosphate acetyltransferase n=1 Tax=Aureimonas altamirensis TaxID=370622 RepID=A0A0B1Q2J7_9HYPH|nr:bifunctional enoyl-CoA hydratase/phosphate acetyltransferase [Aureimonas altamirensis]KHJ53050.1 phosphate acetyltransferase [Aureimonas altamirensis]
MDFTERGSGAGTPSQLDRLLGLADAAAPARTAVVHPVDAVSLEGAVEAARIGLIEPVLIGPAGRIDKAAAAAGIDIAGIERVDVEHSHAAAEAACALARDGRVEALMKGSLHTDELLGAVVDRAKGLRTDRRMSHVFIMDVPTYPRPLFISDAAINIAPDLATKADIVRNAIDCAHALGVPEPRVAVLAAVETVHPNMPATLDAAALCKMADRGQIEGAIIDGPLAFDNAVSPEAAERKGIRSAVAGRADILIVPDIEAGNMMAKQLFYLAAAQSAGLVMGARVPIMLTSRADGRLSRLASAAAALLVARRQKSVRAAKQDSPA